MAAMKITIRPVQRGKTAFVVEAEPSQTIGDLKSKISVKEGYPVSSQSILILGRALQDDKTIESYNVKDGSSLTLVLKAAPAGGEASNSPRIAPASFGGAPRPPLASALGNGSGPVHRAPQTSAPVNFPPTLMPGAGAGVGASTSGFPQNLLQSMLQRPQEEPTRQPRRDSSAMSLGPMVQAIRRMVAENPTLTGPLIEDLKTTDPEGAAGLSTADPDGILRYFSQLGSDGHDSSGGSIGAPTRVPALPPTGGDAAMTLTPADNASIRALEEMGFPRDAVLEAYLSCGKDKDLAANYLVEGVN
ncbi:hypothetical protein BJV74DRAFT_550669 [Russula compacta]|nr:hypothetical protein BJV74DRAFT_550669 [Russula compacta]